MLRVHVAEAKDLEKRDCNVLGIGKSDPYAVIRVGPQEYKTKVIDGTTDPKWDFWCEVAIFLNRFCPIGCYIAASFQFCVLDRTVQHLDVEVLDHDLKSDDFLGR